MSSLEDVGLLKRKMKRITKTIETKYGKIERENYNIEEYIRDWYMIFLSTIIPVVGWVWIVIDNPYKKKWRVVMTFDTLEKLKYYLDYECKFKTEKIEICKL